METGLHSEGPQLGQAPARALALSQAAHRSAQARAHVCKHVCSHTLAHTHAQCGTLARTCAPPLRARMDLLDATADGDTEAEGGEETVALGRTLARLWRALALSQGPLGTASPRRTPCPVPAVPDTNQFGDLGQRSRCSRVQSCAGGRRPRPPAQLSHPVLQSLLSQRGD